MAAVGGKLVNNNRVINCAINLNDFRRVPDLPKKLD